MSNNLQDIKAQVKSGGDINEIVAQVRRQLVGLGGPFGVYSSKVRTNFIMVHVGLGLTLEKIRKLQDYYPASYSVRGAR